MATYLDQDRKAALDWADPAARAVQLQVLAADAAAALDAILPSSDDAEVRTLAWLLTKVLGDDLVTDAQGQVQLGAGTAPERSIRITEPEMHHGRKVDLGAVLSQLTAPHGGLSAGAGQAVAG